MPINCWVHFSRMLVETGSIMDNVLVVDDDPKALITFQEWFKVLYHFDVAIASDGEKAIDMLKQGDISVFCTGINIPKVGGLELLAYITRHHPETPCIVMSEYGVPWFHEKQDRQDVLYYVEKPVHPEALATAIFVGLVLNDEGVAYKGISVRSFLPLIWEKQKTCGLRIESRKKGNGVVYFVDGQVVDASYEDLIGEGAIIAMAGWEGVKFRFFDLPEKLRGRTSDINLMRILDISWRGKRPRIAPRPSKAPLIFSKPKSNSVHKTAVKTETVKPEDKLKKILHAAGQTLRAVPGYQAAGILNTEWEILAADYVELIDLTGFVEMMQTMITTSEDVVERKNLGKCQNLTIQTQKHTIILLTTGKSYHVLVVLAPDSNWYFAKCRVEGGLLRELKSFFWEQIKQASGSPWVPQVEI